MEIVRKLLSALEGSPPNTRYNPDTDTVETSVDGGATWTPNPGADPRVNPAYLLPPNTAPDPRCAAADGMVEYVRQVVNAGIDGTTIAGVGNLLLAAILIFLPVSWFFALIALAAEAIITIGGAALSFSFTEGVYDQLRCIFVEHVDADGRLDAAALTAVQSDVDAIGDVTVSAVFGLIMQMAGHVGLSNAGAKYANPEAECACGWCEVVSFLDGEHGWAPGEYDFGISGEWSVDGWVPTLTTGAVTYAAQSFLVAYDFGGLVVDSFEAYFLNVVEGDFSTAPVGAFRADIYNNGGLVATLGDPVGDHILFAEFLTLGVVWVALRVGYCDGCGNPGGSGQFPQFVIRGQGEPPGLGVPC